MSKWEDKKELKSLIVARSDIAYRISVKKKTKNELYYIERSEDTNVAYDNDDETYFTERVAKIKNHKPNRKERRAQERFYNKLIKKAGKTQNLDEPKFKINTKKLDDVNADIAEVAEETKDNIVGAISAGETNE